MRICCVISGLSAGGAERVLSALSSRWAQGGHEVAVVTLDSPTGDAYQLDARVRRVTLSVMADTPSLWHAMVMNVKRIRAVRSAVRSLRPDVVVAFTTQLNVLAILASRPLRIPVVISERVYPPAHAVGSIWSTLRRLTYRHAAALVVQTEPARSWARSVIADSRVHVIPNGVGPPFTSSPQETPTRKPMVLGVGRLVRQKGFDLLIQAFRRATQRRPEWSLTIVGRGPEERNLQAMTAELLPVGSAVFPGNVPDPERFYRDAGLFVLPSRFEGFPNVLLEAMATGCAVIAADCAAGPADIVRDGVDGILVPPDQIEPLAAAMERLMGDAGERERLGRRAREVAVRFDADRIADRWDAVIQHARLP